MTKEEMIAKFNTWYPQFADKPTNIIDMAYDFASNRVKSNIWTNLYEEGFMALMAHIIYMRTGGANGNPTGVKHLNGLIGGLWMKIKIQDGFILNWNSHTLATFF